MPEVKKQVYLDYNATTPCDPAVIEAMLPYFYENGYNASSLHRLGQRAKAAVTEAREYITAAIGAAYTDEIVFTGGGSEADNLAIKGAAYALRDRGRHVVTTTVEHPAVLETVEWLGDEGWDVTFIPVDMYGMVHPADIEAALRPDTVLVSVMHANNEVGTVMPLAEIGAVCRDRGVLLHTDAVQSVGKLAVDVNDLNVDMLSMAAHKFYGPKGVGALYVRQGIKLTPIIHGGHQEGARRAGTINQAGIVGMAKALELALSDRAEEETRLNGLRRKLRDATIAELPETVIVGHPEEVLPGTVNACFPGIDGESVLLGLDMEGFAVSTGSACSSGSPEPSHVHLAMGVPAEVARGSIRFSLGRYTEEEDIDRLIEVLPPIVNRLREMSPVGSV
ncbi:MAG: cysteine desulfurase [bacterium]|nr:cysteine desulfurase [bacterium]